MLRSYPLLTGLTSLYFLHLILKFARVSVPGFFSQYFADLLCIPLLLSYALLGMRWYRAEPGMYLSVGMILAGVVYVGVVFEGLLPLYFQRYTADSRDVLMYCIGGWVFWVFQHHFVRPPSN
jgi:hypothetical protein